MPTTLDDTDLSWVIFTEDDPETSCWTKGCSAVAWGALIAPCGRHPFCEAHLHIRKVRLIDNLKIKPIDTLTLRCMFHTGHVSYHHGHNPIHLGAR